MLNNVFWGRSEAGYSSVGKLTKARFDTRARVHIDLIDLFFSLCVRERVCVFFQGELALCFVIQLSVLTLSP
jgi:hypothetical protein